MTDHSLPVSSYAEALPYLRAPYTPELVHGIVVFTPDNDQAPCKIALYVSSETVMSRLNIVCGLNWGVRFEKLTQHTITTCSTPKGYKQRLELWLRRRFGLPLSNGESTKHYVQVRAHVTVFGRTFEDLGEATETSEAMAEYKARAQSFKRAVRWVEVGHCLYAAAEIVMWRGAGAKQLRTSETSARPYVDERSERHIRALYGAWLEHAGQRIYGDPLDHRTAAQGKIDGAGAGPQSVSGSQAKNRAAARQNTPHPQQVPVPGLLVNPEIVQATRDAGFSETVARQLTRLARDEEQVGTLTLPQAQTVRSWLADLASLKIQERAVLGAIDVALERSPNRETARTKLADWIRAKAETAQAAQVAASVELSTAASSPDTPDDHVQVPAAPAVPAAQSDAQSALDELAHAIAHYGYQQCVVHSLVALSQGQSPDGQIAWETLPEQRLREITRLLRCAAELGWDDTRLQQTVTRAHNSAHQNTPAGRFAAFGLHLTNAARDRAAEAARAAA
jgi:hypothetical protein